jgi:predicted nucleotidyltransferase
MKLKYDSDALRQFCRTRGIARLELFGSAATENFRSDSDVDLLCTLTPKKDSQCGLLEWVDIQLALEGIFGRPVDLVSRPAIERSRNPYRKEAILAHPQLLYAEG